MLVYSEAEPGKENDEEEKKKMEMREKYQENLRKQGLRVEHVNSTGEQVKWGILKGRLRIGKEGFLSDPTSERA